MAVQTERHNRLSQIHAPNNYLFHLDYHADLTVGLYSSISLHPHPPGVPDSACARFLSVMPRASPTVLDENNVSSQTLGTQLAAVSPKRGGADLVASIAVQLIFGWPTLLAAAQLCFSPSLSALVFCSTYRARFSLLMFAFAHGAGKVDE